MLYTARPGVVKAVETRLKIREKQEHRLLENTNPLYHRSYFFDQGLFFECRRCGACCQGDPGIVTVFADEARNIAHYLSMEVATFAKTYLYSAKGRYSIREYEDGRCFFYQNGCTIYPVRPRQCRNFPFWFENLRSFKKWRQISRQCPGIGSGELYTKAHIFEILHMTFVDHFKG